MSPVRRVALGSFLVLWREDTGAHFRLSGAAAARLDTWDRRDPPPPELRALVPRLRALHLLGGDVDLDAFVACRHGAALLLPDRPVLWVPAPDERGPGGHAHRALPLDVDEVALWRAMNEARTLGAVADRVGVSRAKARAFAARLTTVDVQMLLLSDRPPRGGARSSRLVAAPRPAHRRTTDQLGPSGETTLGAYHGAITDAETHFDEVEVTVAHAFAVPHAALGGQTFGARLHDALLARGLLGARPVLEIGGGDGELGAALRRRAEDVGAPLGPGLRLDASPALLALQAERQPDTTGVVGDATALPFDDASIGAVICNEVIADLMATPVDDAVRARLHRYALEPLPPGTRYNLGAWRLVEEVARVLRPGGGGYISEFGGLDEVPTETTQLDHPEVSIHFGHLLAVARGCGLDARVVSYADLLDVDLHARWLERAHFDALRALWAARGGRLAVRAWTADTVPTPERVEGLRDAPVARDGPGPVVTRFLALLVRKPPVTVADDEATSGDDSRAAAIP